MQTVASRSERLWQTIPTSIVDRIDGQHLSAVELGMLASRLQGVSQADPSLGRYSIDEQHRASGHREGDGGEREFISRLMNPAGDVVLESVEFLAYGTYGDDSFDYDYPPIRTIYLLTDDPLACEVFRSLRHETVTATASANAQVISQ